MSLFDLYAYTHVFDGAGSNLTYEAVNYVVDDPTIEYPTCNIETTFGPIFAPKLWANELSTLELASAGKMVFTLSNEHALDLEEIDKVIYLEARNSNSFCIKLEDESVFLCMNNDSNAMTLGADEEINFATPDLNFQVENFSVAASNDISLVAVNSNVTLQTGAGDIVLDSADDVDIDANNDIMANAGNDVLVGASNDVAITASNDLKLTSVQDTLVESGSTFAVDAASNIVLETDAELFATASNGMKLESLTSNVELEAAETLDLLAHDLLNAVSDGSGGVTIQATSPGGADVFMQATSNVDINALEDFRIDAANDGYIAASNNLYIDAGSNMELKAGDVFEVDAGDSIDMAASNDVAIAAVGSNLTLSAGQDIDMDAGDAIDMAASNDVLITAVGSNVTVGAGQDIDMDAGDAIDMAASNDVLITAVGSNVTVGAGQDIDMDAGDAIDMAASNDVLITAVGSNVTVAAGQDIDMDAGDAIDMAASNDVTIAAVGSNVTVSAGQDIDMDAGDAIDMAASNDVLIAAVGSNVTVTAGQDVDIDAGDAIDMAASNDVLIAAVGSNVTVTAGQDVDIDAGDAIDMAASNDVLIAAVGSNVTVTAGEDIDMDAGDAIDMAASNDVLITAVGSNVTVAAGQTVDVDAGDAIDMAASNSVAITAVGSNVTVTAGETIDMDGSDIDMDASDTITVSASNGAVLESATSNVQINAHQGVIELNGLDIVLDSENDITATASNSIVLTSETENIQLVTDTGSVLVESQSNVQINAADSVEVGASNTATFSSCNLMTITSTHDDVQILAPNGDIFLNVGPSNEVVIGSGSNTFSVGGNAPTVITNTSNITLESYDNSVVINAGDEINLFAENGITLHSRSNLEMSACNDIVADAGENFLLTTGDLFDIKSLDGKVELDAGTDINLSASNHILLVTENQDITIDSGKRLIVSADEGFSFSNTETGNIFLANEAAGGKLETRTQGDLDMQTASAVSIAASNGMAFTTVAGNMDIGAPDGSIAYKASGTWGANNTGGSHHWQLGNTDVVSIGHNDNWPAHNPGTSNPSQTPYLVTINADFEILGNINTVGISETTLEIEDKVIYVAYNHSNALPQDGTPNNGAGLEVDGIPTTDSAGTPISSDPDGCYEKSLKWYKGTGGVPEIGAAWQSDTLGPAASFWELEGGDFRITKKYDRDGVTASNGATRNKGDEITYGFRVNELEELEFYKRVYNHAAGSSVFKRISKFGRQMIG